MKNGFQLRGWIDSGAHWLLTKLTAGIHIWLATRREGSTYRQREYIEGMLAEYAYESSQWYQQGMSNVKVLLLLLPKSIDACRGICCLTIERYLEAIRLLLHANDEFLTLLETVDASPVSTLRLKKLFRLLHHLTGNIKYPVTKVRIRLSPIAQITHWDAKAETLFGWTAQDVLGKEAVGMFVPQIESGTGRAMASYLQDICQFRDDFSLNVNENQNAQGKCFSMFWVNVPLIDSSGDISELLCVGMKTDDPELMRKVVKVWRRWRYFRRTSWIVRRYIRKTMGAGQSRYIL